MRNAIVLTLIVAALAVGCARPTRITYLNVTPDKPESISATVTRPAGPGPFPAVVLLHGCGGASPQLERWARWLADRGYVGLVVDSFGPRKVKGDCAPESPDDIPLTARLDDALGALRWLQAQPWVRGDRVGSRDSPRAAPLPFRHQRPSLERAARRACKIPSPASRGGGACIRAAANPSITSRVKPLLVLIGAADDWTLPEPCQQMVDYHEIPRGGRAHVLSGPITTSMSRAEARGARLRRERQQAERPRRHRRVSAGARRDAVSRKSSASSASPLKR